MKLWLHCYKIKWETSLETKLSSLDPRFWFVINTCPSHVYLHFNFSLVIIVKSLLWYTFSIAYFLSLDIKWLYNFDAACWLEGPLLWISGSNLICFEWFSQYMMPLITIHHLCAYLIFYPWPIGPEGYRHHPLHLYLCPSDHHCHSTVCNF